MDVKLHKAAMSCFSVSQTNNYGQSTCAKFTHTRIYLLCKCGAQDVDVIFDMQMLFTLCPPCNDKCMIERDFSLLASDVLTVTYSMYPNVSKFPDRQVWANSADQDQTAPRRAGWSGSTLFAILDASSGCIILRKSHLFQLLGWLQQIFWVSEIWWLLWYLP